MFRIKHILPKKKFLSIASYILTAALLCTGSPLTAHAESDTGPLSIFHFFVSGGSGPSGGFWSSVDRFRGEHPDADLDLLFVDSSSYSEMINIMMAGDMLPDIWVTKADILPILVDENLIQAAGSFVEADPSWMGEYNDDVFLDITYKDTIWGVPYQTQPNCVGFYNESIFKECGIDGWPDTIQELYEDCEKIKAAGYTPIALGNKDQWPAASTFLGTLAFKYMDRVWFQSIIENTGGSFNDPGFIKALYQLKDMSRYFNEDMNSITQDEMESMYYNRRAAMFFCGGWAVGAVIQNCPKDVLASTHVALMPAVEGEKGSVYDTAAGAGWYYVLNADLKGEKLDLALSFVRAVTCGKYAEDALEQGYFSAAKINSENAADTHNWAPLFEEYSALLDKMKFCPIMDCSLPPEIGSGALAVDTQKLLIGEMTPEEMAADLQAIMQASY